MYNWCNYLADTDISTSEKENTLILGPTYQPPAAPVSTCPAPSVVILDRIPLIDLVRHFGRAPLVRVLFKMRVLDRILSEAASIEPSTFRVHSNTYGLGEFAHTPMVASPSFISFNMGNPRVREIFSVTMQYGQISTAALVAMYLHEKAHRSLNAIGQVEVSNDHKGVYYKEKEDLKQILVEAMQKRRDPFYRGRYGDHNLHTAQGLHDAFPGDRLAKMRKTDGTDA